MSEQGGTLVALARELLLALEPLREGFTDPDEFRRLLYSLGWNVTGMPAEYLQAGAEVAEGVAVVERMADGPVSPAQMGELLGHVTRAYDALAPLPVRPPGMDASAVLGAVGKNLSDLLICQYLARRWPAAYALLSATEVIVRESVGDTPTQHGHVRSVFRWEELPRLLQDPHLILQRVYGWGTDTLDLDAICHHLASALYGLGFPVSVIQPSDTLLGAYVDDRYGRFGGRPQGVKWPFYFTRVGDLPVELSFQLLPLPARDGLKPGLVIEPDIPSVMPLDLALSAETTLRITAGSDIARQFGILIRPEGLGVKYPFLDDSAIPSVTFGVALSVDPAEPSIIIGTSGGTRLQMKGFTAGISATGPVDDVALELSLDLKELSVVLAAGDGDGFLRKLLGDGETTVAVPLGIDWSSEGGLGFRGSLNFEVALHPHLQLGPIEIPDLTLSLGVPPAADPRVKLEATLLLKGDVGPLKLAVEQVGVGLYARFTPGNLGPLDLSSGFKPPKGVALAIETAAVRGGGYLRFDPEREQYDGVLQLALLDRFSISALGLITTRLPDGSRGFSLLAILSVEFSPAVQLGMGFMLNGLGGLLGLNRTLVQDTLLLGVRTGTINGILFPQGDLIANAPRIISDLRLIFPPQEGTFLVGPMAKLAWGSPALVTGSVGVVIEIPGAVAILGVLRLNLPATDPPLIVLQAAFAGVIELDKQRLFFFARLFDSRILSITLEGEMGLLLAWGEDGALVFTVGGFHPRFVPPPLPFPSPARLAFCILNRPHGMVRVEGYFAATSNTAQVGAQAQLQFGFKSFGIKGHFGFDALFQFSPFYFVIDANISMALRAAGFDLLSVRVALRLEGPAPWHARGTGRVSFFFFSISANFDVTWGDSAETTLPPIAIVPLLRAELDKRENWSAVLPAGRHLLVSLRAQEEAAGELVLHPLGTLRVSQPVLPLGIPLDKLGAQRPSDARRLELIVTGGPLEKKGDARERFAMAQFQDMDDAAKLSRPSFEPGNGGIDMGVAGTELAADHMARRVVRYEEILIDSEYKRHRRVAKGPAGLFASQLAGCAVTKSRLSQARCSKLDPFGSDKVRVVGDSYTVASTDTNRPHSEAAGSFGSEAEARDHLARIVSLDPAAAATLHVIPSYEAA